MKQSKEKLGPIIYFYTSFNLGLLMMVMKLQELNVLLYENLKQIKEKLRSFRIIVEFMKNVATIGFLSK